MTSRRRSAARSPACGTGPRGSTARSRTCRRPEDRGPARRSAGRRCRCSNARAAAGPTAGCPAGRAAYLPAQRGAGRGRRGTRCGSRPRPGRSGGPRRARARCRCSGSSRGPAADQALAVDLVGVLHAVQGPAIVDGQLEAVLENRVLGQPVARPVLQRLLQRVDVLEHEPVGRPPTPCVRFASIRSLAGRIIRTKSVSPVANRRGRRPAAGAADRSR